MSNSKSRNLRISHYYFLFIISSNSLIFNEPLFYFYLQTSQTSPCGIIAPIPSSHCTTENMCKGGFYECFTVSVLLHYILKKMPSVISLYLQPAVDQSASVTIK